MAGKIVIMSIVKQIILLNRQGHRPGKIGSILGISKNTARKYMQLIQSKDLDCDALLLMEDEALSRIFDDKAKGKKHHHQEELEILFPEFEKELKRTGVNRWVLWGEYRLKHAQGYSYSQFCYHLQQYFKHKHSLHRMFHLQFLESFVEFSVPSLS